MTKKDDQDYPIARALKREGFSTDTELAAGASALSGLLDLQGSVKLAEFLDDVMQHPQEGLSIPLHPIDPQLAVAKIRAGSERILDKYDRAFGEAFRPYYRLPMGDRAHRLLMKSGLLEAFESSPSLKAKPVKKAKRALARTLWSPYDEFVQTQLKRSRLATMDLRNEVEVLLTQVSVFAGQLARVGAALHGATKNVSDTLVNGLSPAMETRFLDGLNSFKSASEPEDIDHAFSAEGWIRGVFDSYGRLARGVILNELRQIEHLVHAAITEKVPSVIVEAASDSEDE